MKQSSLSDILESENLAFTRTQQKYGEYFKHAIDSYDFLQKFVDRVDSKSWLFIAFLAHVRKHHLLALLSSMRLHHVQTAMNIRQMLESGVNAAYAMANPNPDDFVVKTPENLLEAPKKKQNKRYKWLKDNYSRGSDAIKNIKKQFQMSSHSNLIDVHRTFKYQKIGNRIELKTPFFDEENPFHVKSDLWIVSNAVIGLTDLFYGVNQDCKVVSFIPDFVEKIKIFEKENIRLKSEMMATDEYKRADQKAKEKDAREKILKMSQASRK